MKRIKILACFLILGASVSSCDDFLSEVPDNRTQLDNEEKIAELLVNAYPAGTFASFAETMSDNAFDSEKFSTTGVINTQNFEWDIVESQENDTPSGYWVAAYRAISHANSALEAIDKLGGATTKKLKASRGEALLARAYAHFMLVNLWSKTYNPATADSDLGIPYVETVETEMLADYKRGTVASVYDKIERDLTEGLTLVGNDYEQPKYHFNVNAAKAFAARFYLFKGEWEKVIEMSDHLGSAPTGKIRDYKTLITLTDEESYLQYMSVGAATNLLISTVPSRYFRDQYSNRYCFTSDASTNLYGVRTNPYGKSWAYNVVSFTNNTATFINNIAEYFKITNANAGTGNAFVTMVLFSNDELFLNRIEAHVMLNQMDLAMREMDFFLATRTVNSRVTDKITMQRLKTLYEGLSQDTYTPFYSLSEDQSYMIQLILDARRRDFYVTGLRWLDVRRFNVEVTHRAYNKAPMILTKDDLRRQVQVPIFASDRGIEKNPR